MVVFGHILSIDSMGVLGVVVFFSLSGYLITSLLLVERRRTGAVDFPRFYAHRARRLFPALTLLLIATAAVLIGRHQSENVAPTIVPIVLYVSNYFPSRWPVTHVWSLAIEEQFYLLWPVTLLVLLRVGRRRAVVATVTLTVVLLFVHTSPWRPWAASTLLAGCCFALLPTLRRSGATSFGAAVIVPVLCLLYTDASPLAGAVAVTGAIATGLILSGLQKESLVYKGLVWPPLRHVGKISYGLHLWHGLIVSWLGASPVIGDSVVLRLILLLPMSYGVALLSYELVERRFTRQPSLFSRSRLNPR